MNSSENRIGLFHDRKIEASVLSLLIQFAKRPKGSGILHLLSPTDFFYHQRFFQLLLDLSNLDVDFSMQNMAALLVNRGHSSLLKAFEAIRLVEVSPHQLFIYITTLKRMSSARKLLENSVALALDRTLSSEFPQEIMQAIDQVLHDQPYLPFEVDSLKIREAIDAAESIINNVPAMLDIENRDLKSALREWIRRFENDYESNRASHFCFYIPEVDEIIAGLLCNRLYLVCGEKSSGKTTFLVNLLVANATTERKAKNDTVLFISPKPTSHVTTQLIAVASGIEYYKLSMPGFFAENNWSDLIKGASRLLDGLKIIFIDTLDTHFCDADALVRNVTQIWRQNEELSLVIVDDAYRLLSSKNDMLEPLKELAVNIGVPVIGVVDKKFEELTIDSNLPADVVIGVNKSSYNQRITLQYCSFFFKERGVTLNLPVQFRMGKHVDILEEELESETLH